MAAARYITYCMALAFALVFGQATWHLYQESASLNVVPPPSPASPVLPTELPSQLTILPADPVQGSSTAKVTIVEFSDFQCPYCAQVAPILASAVTQSQGRVRLVWKDFPLPTHPEAEAAAEAAQCAGQQGKFWQYHDQLFQNQSTLGPSLYTSLAASLGLATDQFQLCLTQHQLEPFIQRNVAEATAIGINATPSLVIGGQLYSGTFTADQLAQYIQ